MVKLTSPLNQVDTAAGYALGSKTMDKSGNEYIYLSGVASCANQDWVTFTGTSSGSVTRLATTGGKGNVGIAQGAITNNRYGWFLIKGEGKGNVGVTVTAAGNVYASGTVATVGTAIVSGDLIGGAFVKAADSGSGSAVFSIQYPFCTDTMS
jgi:hypothetical protein